MNFDSDEEMHFYWWLQELEQLGYIKSIEHQPKPFDLSDPINVEYHLQMKTKGKYVSEEIMKGHIYTPDFYIVWSGDLDKSNIFETLIESDVRKKKKASLQFLLSHHDSGVYYSYIEVKPVFDQNNMTRLFKINQKWVWEKHGIYVNMVVPQKHFNKTFTPKRFFTTDKSGRPRKINYKNLIRCDEFLKENQVVAPQKTLFDGAV